MTRDLARESKVGNTRDTTWGADIGRAENHAKRTEREQLGVDQKLVRSSGYLPPLSRKCSHVERPRALTVKRWFCRIGFKQAESDQRLDCASADGLVGFNAGDDETPAECSTFGDVRLQVSVARLVAVAAKNE
jgi:hypothetical protein